MTKKIKKEVPVKPKKQRGKFYINRKELMAEIIASKAADQMSDELTRMLQLLTKKYATSSKYIGYTFNDDMQAYAIMMLVRTWRSFKPEKSDNPFAFYTQCVKNSFRQYLNQEKKHRTIRDELMVNSGLTPSLNFQMEHQAKSHFNEDEEDHAHIMSEAEVLQKNE